MNKINCFIWKEIVLQVVGRKDFYSPSDLVISEQLYLVRTVYA